MHERDGDRPEPWEEGRDGRHPVYREWLGPPWWLWLVTIALTGMLGVAFGAPYGARVGWLVFVPLQAAVSVGLLLTGLRVRVDERVLRAGRARLPLVVIAVASPLTADEARLVTGRLADPRAFLALRTWTTGRAVRVDLCDPLDPHPYWLVSTRRPDQVVAALAAAQSAAQSGAQSGAQSAAATGPGAARSGTGRATRPGHDGTGASATGQSGPPRPEEEGGTA